ncbi:FRG domain-containing protein [Paraburkholderia sp. USG1]|uniref:FRG domain-containing protein n=1 Tax=Paraburkholderia sp. USG1 TaxID=2952268 RepID=UPI00285BEF7C|nr:FRG domain-containing protein [Paraburkholderia sp. USG1]MDR8402312.1 FRG domain-containing protein [Paraburkholderia sp. USG1]
MNGQWLGTKYATAHGNDANLVVNLDRVGETYEGLIFNWPINPPYVCSAIPIRVAAHENPFATEAVLLTYTGQVDVPFPFIDSSLYLSQVTKTPQSAARRVYIEGDWHHDRMRLSYTTDLGDIGHAVVHRMGADQASTLKARVLSWQNIKDEFFRMPYRKHIFRGQSDSRWPLRSLFHREGRAELYRYTQQDVTMMYRRLSGALSQPLDIVSNDGRGAFLHLLQHHGYPTPLLDWSFSPFVAAFFAFRRHGRVAGAGKERHVRIYKFDHEAWTGTIESIPMLATPRNNLSFLEFQTQNNPRAIPQQALSSVTSVDDVEGYVALCEQRFNRSFLEAFDVPVSEASEALSDLRLMGITAGALFPGIDGACEEIRSLRFP